jgi:hypothetical protein
VSRSSVHSVRRYVFEAPVETVWAGIGRVGEYRTWWPWLADFTGTGLMAGDCWSMAVHPPAPYRLRVRVALVAVVAPHRIDAEISGDVIGTAGLVLTPVAASCELVIDSALTARRRWVRFLCTVVPGLAARSHRAVLDAGARQFAARGLGVAVTVGPGA